MPAGRSPKYKNVEEVQEKLESYFNSLFRPVLVWDKKLKANIVLTNPETNKPYLEQYKPVTTSGLALALGFTSRTSLFNYSGKKEFMNAIARAKLSVEEYTESRLFDRDGARGAEFSLRCNFHWNDKESDIEAEKALIADAEKVIVSIRKAAGKQDSI